MKAQWYCAPTCRAAAAQVRIGQHRCQWCERTFIPKAADRMQYCSRECAFAQKKDRSLDKLAAKMERIIKGKQCRDCGVIMRSGSRSGYCSDECRKRKARSHYHSTKPRTTTCAYCPAIVPTGQGKRLCVPCRDRAHRATMKRFRVARKARQRGATTVPFSPSVVFERDGYRCQMCGIKTLLSVGCNTNRYPNLDHIIPLSRGGAHTMENTQCLCRKCNMAKRSEIIPIQTRLAW